MNDASWMPSGNPWRAANWSFTVRQGQQLTPLGFNWSWQPILAHAAKPRARGWTVPAPQ
jgi:hypothetical protein